MVTEIEINHSIEIDKDKTLNLTVGDNQKIDVYNMDMAIRNEATDAKIMVLEVTVQIEAE